MSGTTVLRFSIALSDVERELFTDLDLRLARHPSETSEYLVTRVLAAALLWREGLTFASGGLSDKDRPALFVEDAGRVELWVEVGAPSVDRFEKASKKSRHVVLVTTEAQRNRRTIEKSGATVELIGLPRAEVARLGETIDRHAKWQVTVSGGTVFVADGGGESFELVVERETIEPG